MTKSFLVPNQKFQYKTIDKNETQQSEKNGIDPNHMSTIYDKSSVPKNSDIPKSFYETQTTALNVMQNSVPSSWHHPLGEKTIGIS